MTAETTARPLASRWISFISLSQANGREISLCASRHVCRSKREKKKRRLAPFEMTVGGREARLGDFFGFEGLGGGVEG